MFQAPSEKEEFLAWQQDLEAEDKDPNLDRPTVFRWTGDGKEVFLSGSFNNWANKIPLIRRWEHVQNSLMLCIHILLVSFISKVTLMKYSNIFIWHFLEHTPTFSCSFAIFIHFYPIFNAFIILAFKISFFLSFMFNLILKKVYYWILFTHSWRLSSRSVTGQKYTCFFFVKRLCWNPPS